MTAEFELVTDACPLLDGVRYDHLLRNWSFRSREPLHRFSFEDGAHHQIVSTGSGAPCVDLFPRPWNWMLRFATCWSLCRAGPFCIDADVDGECRERATVAVCHATLQWSRSSSSARRDRK